VLSRVGPTTYHLALPCILKFHNVFHFSLLNNYVHDITHVVNWKFIQVDPPHALESKEIVLWNQVIAEAKVHCRYFSSKDATWEMEETMRNAYPSLFCN
jgi:hypothetical protein